MRTSVEKLLDAMVELTVLSAKHKTRMPIDDPQSPVSSPRSDSANIGETSSHGAPKRPKSSTGPPTICEFVCTVMKRSIRICKHFGEAVVQSPCVDMLVKWYARFVWDVIRVRMCTWRYSWARAKTCVCTNPQHGLDDQSMYRVIDQQVTSMLTIALWV